MSGQCLHCVYCAKRKNAQIEFTYHIFHDCRELNPISYFIYMVRKTFEYFVSLSERCFNRKL